MDDVSGLDPGFAQSIQQLLKASGGKLSVASGYRTPQRQASLFADAVKKYGSEEKARHWVAPPGRSNHNKGLAVDLSGDLDLAHRLAPQFGLHFPMSYERWHVEPVGSRGQAVRKQQGVTRMPVSNGAPMPQMQQGVNGGIDLYSFLQGVANRQGAAPPHLYDPYSSTDTPNPGYNPAPHDVGGQFPAPSSLAELVGANGWQQGQGQQPGPAAPYDERQTIQQPSLYDQATTAARGAQAAAPNPEASKVAELRATAGLHKSLADLIAANPEAQYQMEDYLPLPQRQQAAIPQRGQPQYDPMSGALATLFGLADPQGAGQYGAAPLNAGLDVAAQQYQDAQRQYQMKEDQLAKQYEDQLMARNDAAHYQHEKAGVNFRNASSARDNALRAAQEAAQGTSQGGLADVLNGIGEQGKAAGGQQLQAQQLHELIDRQLAQNAGATSLYQAGNKQENDLLKTIITATQRGYSADTRAGVGYDANQARRDVGAGNNAASVQRANIGASARIGAAQIGAGASKYKADKVYDAAVQKINATNTKAQTLQANPVVPANLRSQMSHYAQLVQQTHKKALDLKATGQQVPPELVQEQTTNAAAYDAAVKQADEYVKSRTAKPGAPAAPQAPGNRITAPLPPGFGNARIGK